MSPRMMCGFGVVVVLMSTVSAAWAADHRDAPGTQAEPAADINDVYTFINPNDTDEVIFIMTVHPLATVDSAFSDAIEYTFNLENNAADPEAFTITCTFDDEASQGVECDGPGGETVSGDVGTELTDDLMRVEAGVFDDPFFFDLTAFQETLAGEGSGFTDPGDDFFAGLNTLAIVVGVDRSLVDAADGLCNSGSGEGTGSCVLSVYASTRRIE